MSIEIHVLRRKASLRPYRDPDRRAWDNNDANNSLDKFVVMDISTGVTLFESPCQTVSNSEGIIDGARYDSTIAPGKFEIQLWTEPRAFRCIPHGIRLARTMKGDYIGSKFTTPSDQSRWLIHDWQKPSPGKGDTRVAWSAGCIVIPTKKFDNLNQILRAAGKKPGDIVPCELHQEE